MLLSRFQLALNVAKLKVLYGIVRYPVNNVAIFSRASHRLSNALCGFPRIVVPENSNAKQKYNQFFYNVTEVLSSDDLSL